MSTKEKAEKFDLGLRHKSDITSDKFIQEYCKVFREYAFATQDDSLNEFEKLITHVLSMLVYYRRFTQITVGNDFDPRELVWAFEDKDADLDKEKIEKLDKFVEEFLRENP